VSKSFSTWDRIVYGAIAGFFGAIFGLVASLLAAMIFGTLAALSSVVIFSVIYFSLIGVVRGPDAGFLVAEALSAIGAAIRGGSASNGFIYPGPVSYGPRAWRPVWTLVVWLGLVGLITWRS
jgi:hypothetical protein